MLGNCEVELWAECARGYQKGMIEGCSFFFGAQNEGKYVTSGLRYAMGYSGGYDEKIRQDSMS